MATSKKNKVKFGLQNVYWAKINEWGEDPDGNKTVPAYGPSKHLPGAVSLSIDANGEAENFYADNGVYYVINNNAGYTGDLEIALITTEFATEILGEILDNNGVLVEKNDTELAQFALMFEFLGDKHRDVLLFCFSTCNGICNNRGKHGSQDGKAVAEGYPFADRSCEIQDNRKYYRSGLQQLVQDAV